MKTLPSLQSAVDQTERSLEHMRGQITHIQGLTTGDVAYLDQDLLDKSGLPLALKAQDVLEIDPLHLRVWLHKEAIYAYPTSELVAFVQDWAQRVATLGETIEIGAGRSGLGRHVGVVQTDSFVQVDNPAVRQIYQKSNQPIVRPSRGVLKADGVGAVRRLKPKAVFGSWITQLWPDKNGQGSQYGVDEQAMLALCPNYLTVGADFHHGAKHINEMPHDTVRAPWIVSRAKDPASNFVRTWPAAPVYAQNFFTP